MLTSHEEVLLRLHESYSASSAQAAILHGGFENYIFKITATSHKVNELTLLWQGIGVSLVDISLRFDSVAMKSLVKPHNWTVTIAINVTTSY